MMGKGFGYVQKGYQKGNFIGGPIKKAFLYPYKLMSFKRYYGMVILVLRHFQKLGVKFDDKKKIYLAICQF